MGLFFWTPPTVGCKRFQTKGGGNPSSFGSLSKVCPGNVLVVGSLLIIFPRKKACRGRPKSWSNSSIFHSKLKLSIMLILTHKRGKYQVSKNKKNSLPILGAFAQCIGGILFLLAFSRNSQGILILGCLVFLLTVGKEVLFFGGGPPLGVSDWLV